METYEQAAARLLATAPDAFGPPWRLRRAPWCAARSAPYGPRQAALAPAPPGPAGQRPHVIARRSDDTQSSCAALVDDIVVRDIGARATSPTTRGTRRYHVGWHC